MINIKNLTIKLDNRRILNNINIQFPSKGLVCINGESGCGKTTLLNAISGMLDYDGEIIIDGKKQSKYNEREKDNFRNSYIGFVFQDYKLFDFESVEENIMLALDIKCKDSSKIKNNRINDLLKIIGLTDKKLNKVANLSGGEKQRVAIARALSNSPSIILADEPTGNLDSVNSESIMQILKSISQRSLVLMVSHDEYLCKKYADYIARMKDGAFVSYTKFNNRYHLNDISLIKIKSKENKGILPLNFVFRHTFHYLKQKKLRTCAVTLTTAIGLIGVGLSINVSSIISKSLTDAYSSIIDSNNVISTTTDSSYIAKQITSLNYDEVVYLNERIGNSSNVVGSFYLNDLNSLFTSYSICIEFENSAKNMPILTPQHFNEYQLFDEEQIDMLPYAFDKIEMDEVVLGGTYGFLNEICYLLQISRTTESLSNYLKNNTIQMVVNFANEKWDYAVDFNVSIIGFCLMEKNCLLHSSPKWNEYIFENQCKLTSTNINSLNTSKPWNLIKCFYIYFTKNRDEFLEQLRFKNEYKYVVGEILTSRYCTVLCINKEVEECNRVIFFNMDRKDEVLAHHLSFMEKSSKHISNYFPGSNSSYAMYPDNLMMGFSKRTFVTADSNYLSNIIDLTSYIKTSDDYLIDTPENTVMGYFAKSNGLKFNPNYSLLTGNEPSSYDEIVISKGLCDALKIVNPLNKSIYLCFPFLETILSNGYLKREYVQTDLKIVGVSSSEKFELNHKNLWTIMFFQCVLGISSFDLRINSVCFTVEDGFENIVVDALQKAFPQYSTKCPLSTISGSVGGICNTIEKILVSVSASSILIACFLFIFCSYINFEQIKKDIGLTRCLGVGSGQTTKFIFCYSLLVGLISFTISAFELVFVSLVLGKSLGSNLLEMIKISFNTKAFLVMLVIDFSISVFASIKTLRKTKKIKPLDCFQ